MNIPLNAYNAELLALASAVMNISPHAGKSKNMTTTERKAVAVKWRNWQSQLNKKSEKFSKMG